MVYEFCFFFNIRLNSWASPLESALNIVIEHSSTAVYTQQCTSSGIHPLVLVCTYSCSECCSCSTKFSTVVGTRYMQFTFSYHNSLFVGILPTSKIKCACVIYLLKPYKFTCSQCARYGNSPTLKPIHLADFSAYSAHSCTCLHG